MTDPYIRPNILRLGPGKLDKLRDGFSGLYEYAYDDPQGFAYWASYHGHFRYYCPHTSPHFLTWHRAYVLALENALQDVLGDYEFGLPYWDWTTDDTVSANALPAVFAEEQYVASDGTTKDNPLHHGRITLPARRDRSGAPVPAIDRDTHRRQGAGWVIAEAASRARGSLSRPDFDLSVPRRRRMPGYFQYHCEDGHNYLHGWIGGDMSDPSWAAFDPIFWFHHTNVDRLFAMWQDQNPNASIPGYIRQQALRGFSSTGGDMLDYRGLGYEYASSISAVDDVRAVVEAIQTLEPLRQTLTLPPGTFTEALLVLDQVQYPEGSLEIRVFVDQDDADADTPTSNNPYFAGARFIFSHEQCTGANASHCDWKKPRRPLDPRGPHHLQPFDLVFDLTECLGRLHPGAPESSPRQASISLVLVSAHGDPVAASRLKFSRLSLVTRD